MNPTYPIRYLKHLDIDTARWDACITRSVNLSMYAFSWYLNQVSGQWDALIMGDYDYVFPLPYREKAGFRYVCMPPFTQQLGLFSPYFIEPGLVKAFLDEIPRGFKLVDLNLNTFNKLDQEIPGHRLNRNYELDLIQPIDRIRDAYSSNLKRNLQRAGRAYIEPTPAISPGEIIGLFKANRGRAIHTLRQKEYLILERLLHNLSYRGILRILGATGGPNTLLAALVIAEMPDRSILLFSATERRIENHNALAWLIDRYIDEFAGTQRVFDFEGSNDPLLGRYYAGFGAQETSYPSVHINRMAAWQKAGLQMFRWVRKHI